MHLIHLIRSELQMELSLVDLQKGNKQEFARLVETYSKPIYNLAVRMLNNTQDAEDVLQTTFLKAFSNISRFEGRSSISTWLFRIATNEALMLIRKTKPEIDLVGDDNEDEDIEEKLQLTDWCCLPESELLDTESQKELDQAIRLLPEKLKIVFILRDMDGLSIHETSQVLNLTETAVKTRLLRARLNLRQQLTEYFGERLSLRSDQNE